MSLHTDTIAALSTPPGESGIAVVRMSGASALAVLSTVLRMPGGSVFEEPWEHRRLYHGGLFDSAGQRIDDVMAAVMRGPESYSGEDVVEISCHGGGAVVARVLQVLMACDVRPAEPGEFTKRAFLNGKMDLIQAEAVADLIHARSELQRSVAERQLAGGLSRRIGVLADDMLGLLGVVEANIDFIEEGIDALNIREALATTDRQRTELDDLLSSAALARPLRDGYRVVIAGPVNAGKSSLFNRLVGEARAIVTEIPGTTRDVLRETLVIDGVPFVLHDTAGLRAGSVDRVEAIGMDRAVDATQAADAVLFVVDARDLELDSDSRRSLHDLDGARSIVVMNKVDLPNAAHAIDATIHPGRGVLRVSALTGEGMEELRAAMVRLTGASELTRMARDRAVLNARLVVLMEDARLQLSELEGMLKDREPLELIAARARSILGCYEEATGRRYHDGLLDAIFTRFCIGK